MAIKQPAITVGLTLLLLKDDYILLGKRRNAVGSGEYSLPGGHLIYGENFEQCLKREMVEETGTDLKFSQLKLLCVTNSTKYRPIHHVAITFLAKWTGGEPRNMEPNKNEDWDWYDINDLPQPLFPLVAFAVEAYKGGNSIRSMS